MGMLCRSLRMLCRSLALSAGSSEPWPRERMVGEEDFFVQGLLFPAPHRFPDPGPAGAAAPRHPCAGCVPRDRLGWCDRRERRGGDTATCPHSSLWPLCATFNCFCAVGGESGSPGSAAPAEPALPRYCWCSWNVGALARLRSGETPEPGSAPQTGIETPSSHSRCREAFVAISILPVPTSSLPRLVAGTEWTAGSWNGDGGAHGQLKIFSARLGLA